MEPNEAKRDEAKTEDAGFSRKKFKPEDAAKLETYEDSSMPKGFGFKKKAEMPESIDPGEASKKKKPSFFMPKSNPFDDSIEAYDAKPVSNKATIIAIFVVIGVLAVLLLFKNFGVIGYAVKDDAKQLEKKNEAVDAGNIETGKFDFMDIETVNSTKEPVKKKADPKCAADLKEAEEELTGWQGQYDELNSNSEKYFEEMMLLVRHYQDYYQEKIDEQEPDLANAEASLERSRTRLEAIKEKCGIE